MPWNLSGTFLIIVHMIVSLTYLIIILPLPVLCVKVEYIPKALTEAIVA